MNPTKPPDRFRPAKEKRQHGSRLAFSIGLVTEGSITFSACSRGGAGSLARGARLAGRTIVGWVGGEGEMRQN